MGSSWGHVGLQDRLGPAQERRENDTENDTEKQPEKQPKKTCLSKEREARLFLEEL